MDNVSLVFPCQLLVDSDAPQAQELYNRFNDMFLPVMSIDSHNTAPDDWVFPLPRSTPSHAADDNQTHTRPLHQHREVSLAGSRTRLAH